MSYTNANIDSPRSTIQKLLKENYMLKKELEYEQKEKEKYFSELENIKEAVEDHGYVDLSIDKKSIRLIKDKKK